MVRTAILDSSKERREYIQTSMQGLDFEVSTELFSNKYDFLESLDEDATSFDILLLNTTLLHEGDGVELAKEIRVRNRLIMICFITDTEEYYGEAFSVLATGYLLYPFDVGQLHNCVNFFFHKTKVERRASWMIKERGENFRRIYCRNILYVESHNREIIIHLENGSTIVSYAKLSKAEEELPAKGFLRCHQSYIVNLYFVEELGQGQFFIKGTEIPISRKYQKVAKTVYHEYMFERM